MSIKFVMKKSRKIVKSLVKFVTGFWRYVVICHGLNYLHGKPQMVGIVGETKQTNFQRRHNNGC